jgi:hypothetical protein
MLVGSSQSPLSVSDFRNDIFGPYDDEIFLFFSFAFLSIFVCATTGRLSEHAAQSERAVGTFSLWWYRRLSSHSAKLSRRPAFGPFLGIQPELSLWPGLAGKTSAPSMAAYDAVCWRRPELNCIASVSPSAMRDKSFHAKAGEAGWLPVSRRFAQNLIFHFPQPRFLTVSRL